MKKRIFAVILCLCTIVNLFTFNVFAADSASDKAYFTVNGTNKTPYTQAAYLEAVGTGGTSAADIKVVEVFNVNRANGLVFDKLIEGNWYSNCTIKLNNCTIYTGKTWDDDTEHDGWTIGSKATIGNIELHIDNCDIEMLCIYFPQNSASATDLYVTNSTIDYSFCNNLGDVTFENCYIKENVNMYNQSIYNGTNGVNSKGEKSIISVVNCVFSDDCKVDGYQFWWSNGFYKVQISQIRYECGKQIRFTYEVNDQLNPYTIGISLEGCHGSRIECFAYVPKEPINWHDDVITITTSEELVEFAQVANGGASCNKSDCTLTNHSFVGQTIKLGANIDLSIVNDKEGWWYYQDENIKIDNRIVDFKGTFDGQGHTISKMKYYDYNGSEKESTNSFVSMGMFRTLYGNVKNLTIDTVGSFLNIDGTLQTHLTGKSAPRVVFFALAYKTRGSHISNVHVKNVDILIDNAGVDYSTDALTSANGLVGVVTWDSAVNKYGREGSQYSLFENCSVSDFKAEITGNCGYAGGAFAYKASEMATFNNCSVFKAYVTIGGSVDNYGGFIGEIGLASTVTGCGVADFHLKADQNNRAVGGFMGDTVGGTGWGDSVHITDCFVKGSTITIDTLNAPLGGFVGDLIGGRSAIFTDGEVDTVKLTATNKGVGDGIGTPCIGGFIGGLYGRDDLTANSEHQFTDCTTTATDIKAGNAPAGGFVGAAKKGDNQQMRVSFSNCKVVDGSVTTTGIATGFGGFVGEGDIGTKGTDKNWDEYDDNCTSKTKVNGQAPENPEQVMAVAGTYPYPISNMGSDFSQLSDTTDEGVTYSVYQNNPAASTFRFMRSAPVLRNNANTVMVEFYRFDENGEYVLWRTIELFKDTAFDGTGYLYAEDYEDYRIEGGLASVLAEADEDYTSAVAMNFVDENGELFTDSTIVSGNIKVYAEYGYNVTYKFEGEIPANAELPETKTYKPGEKVEIAAEPFVRGYEFLGWSVITSFTMGEEHVEIVGTWREGFRPATVYVRGEGKDGYSYVLTEKNTGSVVATAECEDGSFSLKMECAYEGMPRYYIEEVDANGAKTGEKIMIAIRCYEGKKSYVAQVTVFAAESIDFN